MRTRLVGAALAAAFLALAAPAAGTPSFQPPSVIGLLDSRQPSVAVDAKGDALAASVQGDNTIVAALRPAGGSFGPPHEVGKGGPADAGGAVVNQDPSVAIGADGTIAAIWDAFDYGPRVAVNPAGAGWQDTVSMETPVYQSAVPNVAVD